MQKLAKEFDEYEKKVCGQCWIKVSELILNNSDSQTKKTGEKGTLFKRSKKDRSAKRAMDDAAATWRREGPAFLEV